MKSHPTSPHRISRLALLTLAGVFVGTALSAAPLTASAKPQPPRTTKIRHVGSFDGMPGSAVSFTLVKKGRKLVKAVNVQISGFSLYCTDNGHVTPTTYATRFPSTKVGRTLGRTGFAVGDIALPEFEWGYKRFAAFLSKNGRKATGDARIRWEQGGVPCGGVPSTWTSQAVSSPPADDHG